MRFATDDRVISLQPNPTTSTTFLRSSQPASLRLTDALGRTVWTGTVERECPIDLQALHPGVYQLQLTYSDGAQRIRRLVRGE